MKCTSRVAGTAFLVTARGLEQARAGRGVICPGVVKDPQTDPSYKTVRYFLALATIEEEGLILALDHYRGRETHSTDDPYPQKEYLLLTKLRLKSPFIALVSKTQLSYGTGRAPVKDRQAAFSLKKDGGL